MKIEIDPNNRAASLVKKKPVNYCDYEKKQTQIKYGIQDQSSLVFRAHVLIRLCNGSVRSSTMPQRCSKQGKKTNSRARRISHNYIGK